MPRHRRRRFLFSFAKPFFRLCFRRQYGTLSKLEEGAVHIRIGNLIDELYSLDQESDANIAESADPCQSLLSIPLGRKSLVDHQQQSLAVTSVIDASHHSLVGHNHNWVVAIIVHMQVQRCKLSRLKIFRYVNIRQSVGSILSCSSVAVKQDCTIRLVLFEHVYQICSFNSSVLCFI